MIVSRYSDLNIEDPSLRPYQQKAKKEIFEAWDKVDNVMFQMPTGTGKTRLFTSIIRDINKYSIRIKEAVKILIVAHRTELIDQIDESLNKYSVPHNVIAGGRQKNFKYPVNVASIQTLTHPSNLLDAKKLKVQFIIIDEAHHALASTYKKLWEMYPGSKKLGVTATPWRMNHQGFHDLFDTLIMSMPVKEFIRQGYLSAYKYYSLRTDSDIQKTIDGIELDRFGEYRESSMEEKMDIGSIRAQLLNSYLSLAKGKKGIIYAINIEHAKHISSEYKAAGYVTVCIDSKTPASERKELVEKFRKGQIDIIVNVDIFSEGFDSPDIEFIQLARPTRSLGKYLQHVVTGLRITKDKQECVILDNVGMYARFGLPNARRHWKQHFIGVNVSEKPKIGVLKGTGTSRSVDMSEGTEDMELIQDVSDEKTSSIESIKSIDVSPLNANDIEKIKHVFDKKANSYKYFWFMSLLQIYKDNQDENITYKQILVKMISKAWKYVFMLHGRFSQSDRLPSYLTDLQKETGLRRDAPESEIEDEMNKKYDELELQSKLSPLLKGVPYRFLSLWIPYTNNGEVMKKSWLQGERCPYEVYNDHIVISKLWKKFFIDYFDCMELLCEYGLDFYLMVNQNDKETYDFYNMRFTTLTKLLKGMRRRNTAKVVRQFLEKYHISQEGKLTPADIMKIMPGSVCDIDSDGNKRVNIPGELWSLKILDKLLSGEKMPDSYDNVQLLVEYGLEKFKMAIQKENEYDEDIHKGRYTSLSKLLNQIKKNKEDKTVRFFLMKYQFPLTGEITPADIMKIMPESKCVIDSQGRKHVDVPGGLWSLKELDKLLSENRLKVIRLKAQEY